MKLLVACLFFSSVVGAQSLDSLSVHQLSLPSAVLNKTSLKPNFSPDPTTPVVSVKPLANTSIVPQNYTLPSLDFARTRTMVNDALRENLMLADPFLRTMMSGSCLFSGSAGALDMISPRIDGLTIWSSK